MATACWTSARKAFPSPFASRSREGSWSVEALDDRRLRTAGSARKAAPALDTVETEAFAEITTLEIVDRDTLRDEDGNTLHRIGG